MQKSSSHLSKDGIPFKIRFVLILQLCIAFSSLCWMLGAPFLSWNYQVKDMRLLNQFLMGTPSSLQVSSDYHALLERNRKRFQTLPRDIQKQIQQEDNHLQLKLEATTQERFKWTLRTLYSRHLALNFIALFFSICLPIWILKQREGSVQAIWLIPLTTVCLSLVSPQDRAFDSSILYPSEQTLLQDDYSNFTQLSWTEQKTTLENQWKRYLITEWLHEIPSLDNKTFLSQAEQGEYYFQLMIWKSRLANRGLNLLFMPSTVTLSSLNFAWEVFLALFVSLVWKRYQSASLAPLKLNKTLS